MKKIASFLFIILLFLPFNAQGAQPQEILKEAVDNVISILEDPAYKDSSKKEIQQERLWEAIKGIFDFKEMSQSTLANNWRNFSEQQRKEFIDVFGRFLGNNYLNKIQSGFKGDKVVYLGQEMITDTKAQVNTKIIRETNETPVDYSMIKKGGSWKIYDVKIEGVSLTRNYRAQFRSILLKETPDQLIQRLKTKSEKQE